MSIGSKIRQIRQDNNIKQESLASHLKIGTGTLSKIENGKLSISADNLFKIVTYANTTIDKVLPDGFQVAKQIINDNATADYQAQKESLLQKRIEDLESWIIDLKNLNEELQQKIKQMNSK